MTAEQAIAFVTFATVAAITPGPSNMMLTATGAVAGVARGMPCLLGVGAGMGLMMFVVGLGLGTVILLNPIVLGLLRWSGAAFLVWLAWRIGTVPYTDRAHDGKPVGFLGAFSFQWLNPKSWLVSLSATSTYFVSDGSAVAQASWIAGLFFVVAIGCGFVWLAFGVVVRRSLRSASAQRPFNITMGVLLGLSVLMVLL